MKDGAIGWVDLRYVGERDWESTYVQRRNALGPVLCDHPDGASCRDRDLAGAGRRLSGAEIHSAFAAGHAGNAEFSEIRMAFQPRGNGDRNPRRLLPRRL